MNLAGRWHGTLVETVGERRTFVMDLLLIEPGTTSLQGSVMLRIGGGESFETITSGSVSGRSVEFQAFLGQTTHGHFYTGSVESGATQLIMTGNSGISGTTGSMATWSVGQYEIGS